MSYGLPKNPILPSIFSFNEGDEIKAADVQAIKEAFNWRYARGGAKAALIDAPLGLSTTSTSFVSQSDTGTQIKSTIMNLLLDTKWHDAWVDSDGTASTVAARPVLISVTGKNVEVQLSLDIPDPYAINAASLTTTTIDIPEDNITTRHALLWVTGELEQDGYPLLIIPEIKESTGTETATVYGAWAEEMPRVNETTFSNPHVWVGPKAGWGLGSEAELVSFNSDVELGFGEWSPESGAGDNRRIGGVNPGSYSIDPVNGFQAIGALSTNNPKLGDVFTSGLDSSLDTTTDVMMSFCLKRYGGSVDEIYFDKELAGATEIQIRENASNEVEFSVVDASSSSVLLSAPGGTKATTSSDADLNAVDWVDWTIHAHYNGTNWDFYMYKNGVLVDSDTTTNPDFSTLINTAGRLGLGYDFDAAANQFVYMALPCIIQYDFTELEKQLYLGWRALMTGQHDGEIAL